MLGHFGGVVREVKTRNWAALQPPPPPVKVRDRLLITAERSAKALKTLRQEHAGREVISIPPDMAFGTGHHATTSTVLRLLVDEAKARQGSAWNLLDLGTGSGVLAIAAEKLGATRALGCDFDEKAVEVAQDNLDRNGTKRSEVCVADVLQWKPGGKWDCIAANLFHDVLEALFPRLPKLLQRGGTLFISGILHTQAESCLAAGRRAGFAFDSVLRRGKWVTAVGHHRKP